MKLGKSQIFLLFCLSLILGVFLGKYLDYYLMATVAMIFIMLITVFWQSRTAILIGFLGVTLVLGALRLKISFPDERPNFIGKLYRQEVELEGVVIREPDARSNKTNLTIKPKGYTGNVLLNVGRHPEYQYGDFLKVLGRLEEPTESEEFSYKNYLARYETYALMRFPKVEKIASGQGNLLKAWLLETKGKFIEVLGKTLPEPHNGLVLGLILGLKRALPEDLQAALVTTGVSHIVVISGYNISIITRNILRTRAWWGRRVAFWISLGVVMAFVVLAGAEASVIRAAIMGMMLVLALNLGRIYQSVNALIFAATVMVVQNPKILNFDIGFQLSFLATLGLVYLSPMFEKWFTKLPNVLNFRTNLASTLAALIFTLPVLIFYFDRISIVALLVNVLVLWVIPYAMTLGIVIGTLGMLYFPLGKLFSWLLWPILQYAIGVIEFFGELPWASVSTKIGVWFLVIYYPLLFIWLVWYRKSREFHYYLEYVKQKI